MSPSRFAPSLSVWLMVWHFIKRIIAQLIFRSGIIDEALDIIQYITEVKHATSIATTVLREPPAARRGATASPNTYFATSSDCITAQIAKPLLRRVATNLAVRRRESAPTNVCAQRALCCADNLNIKPNAQTLDVTTADGFRTRWRVENLP